MNRSANLKPIGDVKQVQASQLNGKAHDERGLQIRQLPAKFRKVERWITSARGARNLAGGTKHKNRPNG